jgi:hypothetical protein
MNKLFFMTEKDLKGISPYKILQWFYNSSMVTTFEHMYKLANLVFSIPATMASVEKNVSAVKGIKVSRD